MSQKLDAAALVEAATGRAPDAAQVAALSVTYRDMLGFVPPRVGDRLALTSVLDPESMALQEAVRTHAMATPAFDAKTTQIIVFAMLMMDLSDAALTHAIAARRAGATWDELQAAISLCYLFRGLPAANRGASVLAEAMLREEGLREHRPPEETAVPIAHIHILAGRTREQKTAAILRVTEALAETLDSPKDRIRVLLHETDPDHWGIAGIPASTARK